MGFQLVSATEVLPTFSCYLSKVGKVWGTIPSVVADKPVGTGRAIGALGTLSSSVAYLSSGDLKAPFLAALEPWCGPGK